MRYYILPLSAALLVTAGNASTYDEAYIQSLEKRLTALEKKNARGSLELQSSDTVLSVGGRIRMEMAYNNPSIGGSGGSNNDDIGFTPNSISTDGEGERGELAMSLKESRVWFKTRKPTEYGVLRTLVEMDFYGSVGNEKISNSHNPRLRHAYAMLGSLAVGQTNSTFMGSGVPETLHAPVDDIVVRQPLVRWTEELESGSLQFAVEQPESILDTNTSGQLVPDDDQAPEIAAKYVRYGLWGETSLAVIARQFRADSDVGADKRDAKIGTAFHLSGRIKMFGGDDLRFGFASGMGLGRYIGAGSAVYGGGSIDADGKITLENTSGGHLAYRHWWGKEVRSTLAYGYVETHNNSDVTPESDKRSGSGHLNILWSPIQDGMLGLEYIKAFRELENSKEYTLDRIQAVASYDF